LRIGWLLAPSPSASRCSSPRSTCARVRSVKPWPRRFSRAGSPDTSRRSSRSTGLAATPSARPWCGKEPTRCASAAPAGGLSLWATLAHDLLAEPLLEEALAEGVSFLPGARSSQGDMGASERFASTSLPTPRPRSRKG
jgi:hypothetical protein